MRQKTKSKVILAAALIAASAATLCSCATPEEGERCAQEWKQEREERAAEERAENFHKGDFSGHTYIIYESWARGAGDPSILHDPDCPCGKGGAR